MTPISKALKLDKPNRAHTLAFIALFVGFACIVLTVVLHYDESNRISKQDAAQAKAQVTASVAELHRLQDAFCGTPTDPGLLPVVASAPITSKTTVLGRELVESSQRASGVIHCPPPKK